MFTENKELIPKYGFEYDVIFRKTHTLLGMYYIDFCIVLNNIHNEPVRSWKNALEDAPIINYMNNVWILHNHVYIDKYKIYWKQISVENNDEYHMFFQIPLFDIKKMKFIINKLKFNENDNGKYTKYQASFDSRYLTSLGDIFSYDFRLYDIINEKHKDHCIEIDIF